MKRETKTTIRKSTSSDMPKLWEIRQQSILRLAPKGMSVAESQKWAASVPIDAMENRFRDADMWIAETTDMIVGWIAIRGNYIDGLYTDPEFAGLGIGSGLLAFAETVLRERGLETVRLDSSVNAEQFYLRRGYKPTGGPPERGSGIPLAKRFIG
jgi:GNAT superfamily N-acetyltransferase